MNWIEGSMDSQVNEQSIPIVCLIATAGRPEDLSSTLSSLRDCVLPPGFEGVMIVESGQQRGVQSVCQSFSTSEMPVNYRHEPVPGKSRALNRAIAELDGSIFVVMTDDDVTFDREWLVAYQHAIENTGRGQFYGGGCQALVAEPIPRWMLRSMPRSVRGWSPDPATFNADKDIFMGCNWGAFVRDLVRAGGFDIRFGPGADSNATGQESQMQRQLFANGLQAACVPEAIVVHHVPRERCSVSWALKRQERGGISRGIRIAQRSLLNRSVSHLLQFIRWPLSHCLRIVGKATRNQAVAFKGECKIHQIQGYFKGFHFSVQETGADLQSESAA